MGKNPAFLYYPKDFEVDLSGHSLETCGAVIRIMNHVFWTGGEDTLPIDGWGRIFGTDERDTMRIIKHLKSYGLCDISNTLENCHGDVTIKSRRLYREATVRYKSRLRQQKKRQSVTPPDLSQNATDPLSSSSSSSSSSSYSLPNHKQVASRNATDRPPTGRTHVLLTDQKKQLLERYQPTPDVFAEDLEAFHKLTPILFKGKADKFIVRELTHWAKFDMGQVAWAADDYLEREKNLRDNHGCNLFRLCVEADDGGFQIALEREERRAEKKIQRDRRTDRAAVPADHSDRGSQPKRVADVLGTLPALQRSPDSQGDVCPTDPDFLEP